MLIKSQNNKFSTGFTLIEVIIGIVVFAISLSIIIQLILPTERNSADQIHQIKAAQLGQALLDDIMSRSFDENSDRAGGAIRCDSAGNIACSNILGPDAGENRRSQYDDVDDFNGYTAAIDSIDTGLARGYNSFNILVNVVLLNDSELVDELNLTNALAGNQLAKRITVTVTTPLGTAIAFTAYKTNF